MAKKVFLTFYVTLTWKLILSDQNFEYLGPYCSQIDCDKNEDNRIAITAVNSVLTIICGPKYSLSLIIAPFKWAPRPQLSLSRHQIWRAFS